MQRISSFESFSKMSVLTPLVDIIETEEEDTHDDSPRTVMDQQRWQPYVADNNKCKREGQNYDKLPLIPRRPNKGSSTCTSSDSVTTEDDDAPAVPYEFPLKRRHSIESLDSDAKAYLRRRLREALLRAQTTTKTDETPVLPRRSDHNKADSTPSKPRRSCSSVVVGLELEDDMPSMHEDEDDIPRLPRRRHSIGSLLPSAAEESITLTTSFYHNHRHRINYDERTNHSTGTTSTCDTKPTDNHTARFETLWHEIVTEDELILHREPPEEDNNIVLPPDSEWMLQNYDVPTSVNTVHDHQAEIKRLKAVHSYHAANGDPDPILDGIACSAQALLQVPVVCIIVLDEKWIWFKSCQGLGESDIVTVPRRASFTAHAVYRRPELGPMVIPDCTQDFRTKESPFVTGPYGLRFFASLAFQCPDTGASIGCISCLDTKIRPEGFSEEEKETMQTLADRSIARLYELKQEYIKR